MAIDKKKKPHYVNNKEFAAAIVKHNEACKVAVANDEEKPRVSGTYDCIRCGSWFRAPQ